MKIFTGNSGEWFKISPMMHPTDHMSTDSLYNLAPYSSSGARYHLVATWCEYGLVVSVHISRLRPKSAITNSPSELINKFAGFKSYNFFYFYSSNFFNYNNKVQLPYAWLFWSACKPLPPATFSCMLSFERCLMDYLRLSSIRTIQMAWTQTPLQNRTQLKTNLTVRWSKNKFVKSLITKKFVCVVKNVVFLIGESSHMGVWVVVKLWLLESLKRVCHLRPFSGKLFLEQLLCCCFVYLGLLIRVHERLRQRGRSLCTFPLFLLCCKFKKHWYQ